MRTESRRENEKIAMTITTEPAKLRTAPSLTGISHVGLTVRDITTSEAWYADVLGLVRVFVEPHSAGEGYAVVMTRPGTALYLGLDHHPDADRQEFSERRTGLDHLALAVETREDLDRWAARLDALGIEHGTITDVSEPVPHAQMTFRDPDGIAIEVFWTGGH
jgi:catechol-2,3-dioxygenase